MSEVGNRVLVLGLGNALLSDDGVGVHVVNALAETRPEAHSRIRYCEGGTLGLSLLPDIEAAETLIVVDATQLYEAPGTLKVFCGAEMDEQLGGNKSSAHEVALSDLIDTARLIGRLPANRALVAIQPETTSWGLEPTTAVAAALPLAKAEVEKLPERWAQ